MKIAKHRNGLRYSKTVHARARQFRKEGKTHREIAKKLGISLGSADIWTRGILLSAKQKLAIQERKKQRTMNHGEREQVSRRLKEFWRERKYSREDLIKKIIDFYNQNGRIPLKREFNAWHIFRRCFGGWNLAIVAAGFDPNPILFAKKFIARDGHRCDSFTEKIIDDWLYEHQVVHERHWHYCGTKMTADFFIQPNVVIEFFGLAGVQKQYDIILKKKKRFCASHHLRLIEIYPQNIFPVNELKSLLSEI